VTDYEAPEADHVQIVVLLSLPPGTHVAFHRWPRFLA
jgi:hypothetical protein